MEATTSETTQDSLLKGSEETTSSKERTDRNEIEHEPKKPAKRQRTSYKKAPDAPRRFKSAYMFFSTAKHREIREQLKSEGKTEKVRSMLAFFPQCRGPILTCYIGLVVSTRYQFTIPRLSTDNYDCQNGFQGVARP